MWSAAPAGIPWADKAAPKIAGAGLAAPTRLDSVTVSNQAAKPTASRSGTMRPSKFVTSPMAAPRARMARSAGTASG